MPDRPLLFRSPELKRLPDSFIRKLNRRAFIAWKAKISISTKNALYRPVIKRVTIKEQNKTQMDKVYSGKAQTNRFSCPSKSLDSNFPISICCFFFLHFASRKLPSISIKFYKTDKRESNKKSITWEICPVDPEPTRLFDKTDLIESRLIRIIIKSKINK